MQNGIISAYEVTDGTYTLNYLTEGGFTISAITGGPTNTIGLSIAKGLIIGQSFSTGTVTSGYVSSYKPRAPLFAGPAIVVGLNKGNIGSLFPPLGDGLAY